MPSRVSQSLETRTCPGYRAERYLSHREADGTSVYTWNITRDNGTAVKNPQVDVLPAFVEVGGRLQRTAYFGFSESEFDAWWPRICRGEVPHA